MRKPGTSLGSGGKTGSASESPLTRLVEGLKNPNSPVFAIFLILMGGLLVLVGYLTSRPEVAESLERSRSSVTEEAFEGVGLVLFCMPIGAAMLVFGIGLLLLHLASLATRAARGLVAPPPDPILTVLDSVGISQFASESYDESKAEMINFISKKMSIARPEVRERIDRLEQQGKLCCLPNGRWVIHRSG